MICRSGLKLGHLWPIFQGLMILLRFYFWRPWLLSRMRVRLMIRRSRIRSPLCLATFFCGDWSWNIFCSHSFPSTDSRRAQKYWLTAQRTKPAQDKISLGKQASLSMTQMGWLGCKTSTQTIVQFFCLGQYLSNYWSYSSKYWPYSSDTWHMPYILAWPLEFSHPYLTLIYILLSTDFVNFWVYVSFLVTIGPTTSDLGTCIHLSMTSWVQSSIFDHDLYFIVH